MQDYQQAFFTVPYRVMQLPDLTIQLLKFYETIFHFWHVGNKCFLNNKSLKERTGMKSDSTIAAAFQYFEKHNEMKRVMKGGKRYIIQPVLSTETDPVDNSPENCSNDAHGLAVARGGSRCSEGGGLAVARDNNINNNNTNIIKSFCDTDEQKQNKPVDKRSKQDWKEDNQQKHAWAVKAKERPVADVTNQSTSYKPPMTDPDPNPVIKLEALADIRKCLGLRKKNSPQKEPLPISEKINVS